jgi:cellulose synthase/poly-beta-1,6-N-acetylglucosamine synthase-like glycosyltransferase
VAVFCPCKGIDPEFEENIRSIVDQDHPDYRVYFIVEAENDPAYGALKHLGATDILVAGHATDRGQKVHNLAFAVKHVARAAAIYAFCDSDGRYPPDWLSNLIPPLAEADVGVATGYRWYVAHPPTFTNLLRSAWNAVSISGLGHPQRGFAWGGSLAIRRDIFERIGVIDAWKGSVSDDYSITRAAQASGLKIIFVPQCLIPTYGECGWDELLEFTTRQMIITRVYYRGLWQVALVSYVLFSIAFVGLALAAFGDAAAMLLWLMVFGLSAARSWVRLRSVTNLLPVAVLPNPRWFYILCAPLVSLLYLYNVIRSALSTSIVWRKIQYDLLSPHKTIVTRPSGTPVNEN